MERDEADAVSIPRGGPIFVPKHTSDLTSTSDFESAFFHELEDLKAALGPEPLLSEDDEDISVDELKVFTDEELISEGMKEIFKEDENSSQLAEHSTSKELLQEGCLEKVERLAKIRQRQKDDRAAAKLHSLAGSTKSGKRASVSSENEKIKSLEYLRCPAKIKPSNSREYVGIRHPETILCVEVYNNKNSGQKTQEILVLGQQKLTELRDAIHCLTDVVMSKADQHDPSGYFLIEDVFYNDMRDPSAIDYSKPIFDWLKNSKEEAVKKWESIIYSENKSKGKTNTSQKALVGTSTRPAELPRFRAADMHSVRFCDLRFHLGARYIYCHQGDCKHEMVFRDMRAVHPEDCQNRAAYPLVVYQHKFRVQKCGVCQVYKATYITVDDIWAGENPCYFCSNCYYLLHYDDKGNLRYDHTVHDYIQEGSN